MFILKFYNMQDTFIQVMIYLAGALIMVPIPKRLG